MVTILAEIGLRSGDFESADDALTYLLGTPNGFPLIVVDHGLPGQLSGAELIEMVKSKWPSTAAVLTSGYDWPLNNTVLNQLPAQAVVNG